MAENIGLIGQNIGLVVRNIGTEQNIEIPFFFFSFSSVKPYYKHKNPNVATIMQCNLYKL
jgi:hypothetical protein